MFDADRKIYRFDDFKVDRVRRKLLRGERNIHLTTKAFDLLVVMAEHNGELLERNRLIELVWPGQLVEESNLSVTVSALRKALGEHKGEDRYIVTIPRQGYRFIADVTCEDAASPQTAVAAGSTVTDNTNSNGSRISLSSHGTRSVIPPGKRQAFAAVGLIFVLLAAAGFGYWRYSRTVSPVREFGSGQMSIRRLTSHGKVVRAALSPDGKYFAYVREDVDGRSLWLGQTADGSSIQLRPPSDIVFGSLVFAPDGNSIYCVGTSVGNPRGVLYRMPTLGTRTETVLEGIDSLPAFSPDGTKFAFVRHEAEKRESGLYVANSGDGSGESLLANRDWLTRFTGAGLSWSPDGNVIAAVVANDSDTGTDRVVIGVRPADGTAIPLTKQAWGQIHRLAWLRDGSGIVMVATDKAAFEFLQLWHLSYPDGEARRVTRDLTTYNQSSLSLSADNTAVLAVQLQQTNNIWIAPSADPSQARQITFGSPGRLDGAYGIDWLPDGKIVYAAVSVDGISIWRADPESGDSSQITPAGFVERRMSVTADGRYMVFESNRSGDTEVWRSDTNGDRPFQLTTGGRNRSAHVAPDGSFVLYASTDKGVTTVRRISIDGGNSVNVTHQDSDWPRISPDGKMFACILRPRLNSPWQLAVFDITGGDPLEVFEMPDTANNQNGFRWTPDGAAITYRDWKEGIWLQWLDGGEPERIRGLPIEKLYAYGWSQDGERLAFTRGTENYDVVLITDIK